VSEFLNSQGCSVVGVELDSTVVQPALQWLERVIVGNIDDNELWDELSGESFDAILFGDVLEHLKDPLNSLRNSVKYLRPSGYVVVSVPNIAHADVKIALMNGTFPYRESGLLDRTHIHFFTKESLLELMRDAGLVVTELYRVTVPVFDTELAAPRGSVDERVLEAILNDRESETYQFVIKAVRDDGERALEKLSSDVIELTDQLHDETRRCAAVTARLDALEVELIAARAQREVDSRELTRLQRRTDVVKRFLPEPLLRLLRRRLDRQ
jgi:SAM-dependent methyltransferase